MMNNNYMYNREKRQEYNWNDFDKLDQLGLKELIKLGKDFGITLKYFNFKQPHITQSVLLKKIKSYLYHNQEEAHTLFIPGNGIILKKNRRRNSQRKSNDTTPRIQNQKVPRKKKNRRMSGQKKNGLKRKTITIGRDIPREKMFTNNNDNRMPVNHSKDQEYHHEKGMTEKRYRNKFEGDEVEEEEEEIDLFFRTESECTENEDDNLSVISSQTSTSASSYFSENDVFNSLFDSPTRSRERSFKTRERKPSLNNHIKLNREIQEIIKWIDEDEYTGGENNFFKKFDRIMKYTVIQNLKYPRYC